MKISVGCFERHDHTSFGGNGFIAKPFRMANLTLAVKSFLKPISKAG
jgi:hypothetical protein